MSHGPFVLLEQAILDGEPIKAISYLEPEQSWESGFMLFSSPPDADHSDTAVMCLDCLLDEHPDIGEGLDLAREHGEAIRNDDEWTTRVTAANG